MDEKGTYNLRISSPHENGKIATDGVNGCCHTWTAGVQPNSKHVMRNPRVVVIFWGHYYRTNPDAVSFGTRLITDLISGRFMNGLAQYGVARGSLAGTVVIDTDANNPAPDSLDKTGLVTQLKQWIKNGNVTPEPTVNEDNLAYFIFPPTTTQLTLNGQKGDTNFCGYHLWDTYNQQSANPDLFFGIVSTRAASSNNATEQAFISALSRCVGHELVESFTDRDGAGYISASCQNTDGSTQTCEIGDICESKATFQYQRSGSTLTWNVQQYWSQWDNGCIHGDQPVSLRAFLRSIQFDFAKGLRSLGTPVINLGYIASRE